MGYQRWHGDWGRIWAAALIVGLAVVGLRGTGAAAEAVGKIGRGIQDELVEFTVHKIEWHKVLKAGSATATPKGEFLVVYMRAENAANVGNRAATPETVILLDGQNRRIDLAPQAEKIMAQLHPDEGSLFEKGKEIWPNLRVDGWIVFDVPKGAKGLRLLVKGLPSSKGKLIDLESR